MELVRFLQMYLDQAVASQISGAVVLLFWFFSFAYRGRDPSPSLSCSCGGEHGLHTGETAQGDLALLFELWPSQFEHLQCFNIKPLLLLLKALCSGSRDSLNPLPESKKDFLNVWSIWIPPVLLSLASGINYFNEITNAANTGNSYPHSTS